MISENKSREALTDKTTRRQDDKTDAALRAFVSSCETPAPVWQQYRSALYCGDCLPMLCAMPGGVFDAVIADPPYNSGGLTVSDRRKSVSKKYVIDGVKTVRPEFSGDSRDQRSFTLWATLWLSECLRATREGGHLMVFSDWRQLPAMSDAIQAAGWGWRGIMAWDKTEGVRPAMGWFRAQCEYVLCATKGAAGKEQERPVKDCVPGIWRGCRKAEDKLHITGKPVPLIGHLMRVIAPGSLILDPFAGSGSTILAALEHGSDCIGIDLSPEYCAIARGRLATSPRQPSTVSTLSTLSTLPRT